nr:immunoglobulin heavy chain junction region [Macaca mulatta]MOW22607.1 immunoglobulin heavy chain junction region [Macaca mulatta]MOW22615.1 immunoglobulin heavy chain junction region [Macaca mulatta]MOW22647.1 immunoglobulin heavy chain junction region [Macaca mulatta]MOW22702.1 immunoglobulin heavy chain junction region [Macaca mulatta]
CARDNCWSGAVCYMYNWLDVW